MKKLTSFALAVTTSVIGLGMILGGLWGSMFPTSGTHGLLFHYYALLNPFLEISSGLVVIVVSMYFFHHYQGEN